jgi:hypothetical protein
VVEAPAPDAGWSEADAQAALHQVAEERAAAEEALQQAAAEHAEAEQALQQAAAEHSEAEQALQQAADEHAAAEQALQQAAEEQTSAGTAEPPAGEQTPEGEQDASEGEAGIDHGPDVDSPPEMTDFDDDEPSTLLDMDTSTTESPALAGATFDVDDFMEVDDPDPDVESLEL